MDARTLKQFQYDTIERVYQLADEVAMLGGSTDLKYVTSEVRRLTKAITAELEGIEEIVKEYHEI